MPSSLPQVSVGVPVYNGGKSLEIALTNLINQTFRDIEIIISDNDSQDNTAEICRKFAKIDSRIVYHRQSRTVSATDNFNFVRKKARASYFMWAADDDTRSLDFIEKLLVALKGNDAAILAFGDTVGERDGVSSPVPLDFANSYTSPISRLHRTAMGQLHHIYGLWRRDALMKLEWRSNEWWSDTPLMMAASVLGDFIYVPGVTLHYHYSKHHFFNSHLDIAFFRRRGSDLCRLVWFSGISVAAVKGPIFGVLAALFASEKIIREITGFIFRRISRMHAS